MENWRVLKDNDIATLVESHNDMLQALKLKMQWVLHSWNYGNRSILQVDSKAHFHCVIVLCKHYHNLVIVCLRFLHILSCACVLFLILDFIGRVFGNFR